MNRLIKYQNGNKFPKIKLDQNFINQKLGYGNTSTLGTAQQKAQQNQAAQQAQANTDAKNYLAALKKGERWAVTKNLQNRGQITQINQKVNGHIPTQNEINQENQLRQNPIKGAGLRWSESWENNTNPVKAVLKSGVLYANPYTGALNAGYNLLNSETGLDATYDAFKNGNYLQGAINGAFNLVDMGMVGNGVSKGLQRATLRNMQSSRQYSQTPLKYSYSEEIRSNEFPQYKNMSVKDIEDGRPMIFDEPYKLSEALENLPKRYFAERHNANGIEKVVLPENAKATSRYLGLRRMYDKAVAAGFKDPEIQGIVNDQNAPDFSGVLLGQVDLGKMNNPITKLIYKQIGDFNLNYPETPIGTGIVKDEFEQAVNKAKNPWLYYSDEVTGTAGYYNPRSDANFINLRNNKPEEIMSTAVHEGISHTTDNAMPFFVRDKYNDLIKSLNINSFKHSASKNWQELRATLNEMKYQLSPKGNYDELKEKLSGMSAEEFTDRLFDINDYGKDYVRGIYMSDLVPGQKPPVSRFKKAILTLPATLPFINKGNSE